MSPRTATSRSQRTSPPKQGASLVGVLVHLLPAVAFVALFAGVGMAHVAGRVLKYEAGYRLSREEARTRELEGQKAALLTERATLRGRARLERLAREELGLALPAPGQLITLSQTAQARRAPAAGGPSTPVRRVAQR